MDIPFSQEIYTIIIVFFHQKTDHNTPPFSIDSSMKNSGWSGHFHYFPNT